MKTNKKIKMTKKRNLYVKLGYVSAKLNFIDTESDEPDRYDTDHLSKHTHFDNDMESFDKKTIGFIEKTYF